jgi:hypothetical protein
MTSMQKRYSMDDYTKVIFDNTYVLSDNVITIIRKLAETLNISTTTTTNVTTNNHSNHSNHSNHKHNSKREHKNESWENLRSFKSTVIEKKEGVDKTISDIRICLNKMSNKNYEKNKESIIQYIESNEENIIPIANAIFDIASTNKFFSDIYAELYRELFNKHDAFKQVLDDFVSKYVANMNDINYVAPTDNYDAFSAYNKKNDARKATSTFIINLVKKGVIHNSVLFNIIQQIKIILYDLIEQPNKIYELEEIMENFYILITESISILLQNEGEWQIIRESIKQISEYKAKEKLSLSTRAIFKCMDILDLEKKTSNKSK